MCFGLTIFLLLFLLLLQYLFLHIFLILMLLFLLLYLSLLFFSFSSTIFIFHPCLFSPNLAPLHSPFPHPSTLLIITLSYLFLSLLFFISFLYISFSFPYSTSPSPIFPSSIMYFPPLLPFQSPTYHQPSPFSLSPLFHAFHRYIFLLLINYLLIFIPLLNNKYSAIYFSPTITFSSSLSYTLISIQPCLFLPLSSTIPSSSHYFTPASF